MARKDSLARFLENRPDQKELENRNILHSTPEDAISANRHQNVVKLGRKLSMRPTAEELENRNILHHGKLSSLATRISLYEHCSSCSSRDLNDNLLCVNRHIVA